jgi:diacylglycerol O-acyltransferase / wax synthase
VAPHVSTVDPLSAADAAWLHMERPTNPMVINGLFVFDEPFEYGRLRQLVEERFLRHRRLRQRVVEPLLPMGRPHWEDDPSFDVEAHLHRVALPRPGDDAALRAMVSDLMSTRLDLSRPLWHFYLVEGYGKGCAVLSRMHHCLGDGASLMRLLLSIADEPVELACAPASGMHPHGNGAHESLARWGLDLLLHPAHAVELARTGLGGAAALGRLLLLPPDPETLLKGPLGVVKRAAWSEPLSLPEVKQAGHELHCTLNDVLLAAMAGALRRYVIERGGQAAESVRAVVPVNIRGSAAVPELGNQFGLVFLSLPLETADPLERLREVKRRMDALKATPESLVAFAILEVMGATAPALERVGVEIFSSKGTLVMTNVPGPLERISLAGHPVRSLMFWVPQSGDIGLGISILSYAGEVRLGVSTDARVIQDPESIVASFAQEYRALVELSRSHAPAIPRTHSAKEGTVMAHIEKSVTIDAPVPDVYRFASDIARFPQWWPSLTEVKNFDEDHAAPGKTYDWTYKMLGLTYHGTDEFTEVHPLKAYSSRACAGDITHAFAHGFEDEGGKTRYTLSIDYTPPGSILGRLADNVFLRRHNEQEADQIVANLKAICEREAAAKPVKKRATPRKPRKQ